eukprot:TRINITY_DN6859_c0_g1_i1.p1 TRINITY_DN6859_c0_g1~~TRINITY_DN6859_c0_g1_i1.p1  ORF type:complete len:992 (+),score=220.96 TRINITY_DN6859_c0_g1_i1:93-2978(+)
MAQPLRAAAAGRRAAAATPRRGQRRAAAGAAAHAAAAPAAPPPADSEGHVALSAVERAAVCARSALSALADPYNRDDAVAAVGELTGDAALRSMLEQMKADPEGQAVLRERPVMSAAAVEAAGLRSLPPDSLGAAFLAYHDLHGFRVGERYPVRFVEDPELRYVMRRFREVHDVMHALLGLPVCVLGETAGKAFEAGQTGMPMAALAAAGGSLRVEPRSRLHLPAWMHWAVSCARSCRPLIAVHWELWWDQPLAEVRTRLGVTTPPALPWSLLEHYQEAAEHATEGRDAPFRHAMRRLRAAMSSVPQDESIGAVSAIYRGFDWGTPEVQAQRGEEQRQDPVLIVGAGPVGLYAALALSRYGVPCVVCDSRDEPEGDHLVQHPRAHVLHARALELLRAAGVYEAVMDGAPPREQWSSFRYCSSLCGDEFAAVDHFDDADGLASDLREHSPCGGIAHVSQPKVEHGLRAALADAGVEILWGRTLVALSEDDGEADALLTRPGEPPLRIRCQELVAADGAASTARDLCGIPVRGQRRLESFVSIHFRSKQLWPLLMGGRRPAMIYWVFNSAVGAACVVAHDLSRGSYVAQVPFFPPVESADDVIANARSIVESLVGVPLRGIDFEISSARPWLMGVRYAERLTSRQGHGRVHLCGDAAQQTSPAGGFGLATGLGHAHNLAWRLAAVHHGTAPRESLRRYDEERHPCAVAAVEKSVVNYERGLRPLRALGVDRSAAARTVGALATPGVPGVVGRGLLSASRALSGAHLDWVGSGSPNMVGHALLGGRLLGQLRSVTLSRRALGMLFPNWDLGTRYGQADASSSSASERYSPAAEPGCRLPHAWLRRSSKDGASEEASTLDLAGTLSGPPRAVLFVDAEGQGPWQQAADGCDEVVTVSVHTAAGAAPPGAWADESGRWAELRGVPGTGCVLVRPDGHVAWRAAVPGPDARGELRSAVAELFGRAGP